MGRLPVVFTTRPPFYLGGVRWCGIRKVFARIELSAVHLEVLSVIAELERM